MNHKLHDLIEIEANALGFDLVRTWRPTASGLAPDHDVVLPRGTGPRHLVLHPSGHLHVVTEYSGEVFSEWQVIVPFSIS